MTLGACGKAEVDAGRIAAAGPGDWLVSGRTYEDQRFSPLDQINAGTVARLGVAWWAKFDTDRGQEATPVIADGVLYTTTSWSKVFAFEAKSGRPLWSYDPKVAGEKGFDACCDVVNRGVALWQGRVYVGALDGRLIALNGRTGRVDWSVQTTDPKQPYTITGVPTVVKGKVIIGNGGSEYPVRGYVSAYDADTGNLAWRFQFTPNPTGKPDGQASDKPMKDFAAATWGDGAWKANGGGASPWNAITYDPKTDLVFIGTGNAGPWNSRYRSGGKGDNLFTASIVALKPETGAYVWHYQTTPRDDWDFDAVQHLMVADLNIGGAARRVVMQANKNGFFYVLDAATGKLLSADAFVPVSWAEKIDLATGRPVEKAHVRYADVGQEEEHAPASLGGHNWQPMAFDPKQGLVFIPAQVLYANFANADDFVFTKGAWNLGLGPSLFAPDRKHPRPSGRLIAWDPVARQARWSVDFPQPWRGGVLATGGGLVFHAAGHEFIAFDANTGRSLWRYDTGANAIAAASSYAVDGVQYVALMVGQGGAGGLVGGDARRPGRLLVFKLDGKAPVPPVAPATRMPPLDLTAATAGKGDAARGEVLWRQFCVTCHVGAGYLPLLPRSPLILEPEGFKAVVIDGARKEDGMASFARFFDAAGAEDLRAFLLKEAARSPPTRAVEVSHPGS